MAPFDIERDIDARAAVVRLRLTGRFDRSGRGELLRALLAHLRRRRPHSVVVDVGPMTFISAECVDALLIGYTAALRAGCGYQVVNAAGRIRKVLRGAGLGESAVAGTPRPGRGRSRALETAEKH